MNIEKYYEWCIQGQMHKDHPPNQISESAKYLRIGQLAQIILKKIHLMPEQKSGLVD